MGEPTSEVAGELAPRRRSVEPFLGAAVVAVAAGGVLGSLARYGIGELWPNPPGTFPWAVLAINATGSFLLGALLVLISDRASNLVLLRPFLGTGVLGGFTTFSTFATGAHQLLRLGHPVPAAGYLVLTAGLALLAAWAGMRVGRLRSAAR
jgi:CrcB protein